MIAQLQAWIGSGPRALAVGRGMALILALCLVPAVAEAEVTLSFSESREVPLGAGVSFELRGEGVTGLGALQFEVRYTPKLLTFREVKGGPELEGAMIEAKEVSAGVLKVAIVCSQAVKADGGLLTLTFDDRHLTGDAILGLVKLRGWDEETLAPLTFSNRQGIGNVRIFNPNWWIPWAVGGGLGLVLLLWLVFGRKRLPERIAPPVTVPPPTPGYAPPMAGPAAVTVPGSGRFCGNCRTPLVADAAFCARCGQAVPPPAAPAFCHKCGKPMAPQVKFCTGCGARVNA